MRGIGTGLAVLFGLVVVGEGVARLASASPRAAAIGAALWLAALPIAIVAGVIAARRQPPAQLAEGEEPAAPLAPRIAMAGGAIALVVVAGALALRQSAPPPADTTGNAASTPGCWLRFELRLLRAAIPDVVGDCVENPRRDPVSGDTLQRTTGGLLVLRQSDRRAAFTDGSRTWMQGPDGIASRPNEERFPWEPDASTPTPSAPTAEATVAAPPQGAAPTTTALAVPATATPRPVILSGAPATPPAKGPTPTSGPSSDGIMDAVLIGYLRQSGLPLSEIRPLTATADPEGALGRPGGPISRIAFKDQRTPNAEQYMEMYADAQTLQSRLPRLNDPAQSHQVFTSPGARTLIRLSKGMAPDQLRSYQTWLQNLR